MKKEELRLVQFRESEYDDFEKGYFHKWSIYGYPTMDTIAHVPTAIVEKENGEISLIQPENIKFL